MAPEYGQSVPESVSVVGYDDSPESTAYNLTTIHLPVELLGQRVADLTAKRFRAETDEDWVTVALKPTLVERGTTSPLIT